MANVTSGGSNYNFKVVLLGEGCVGKTSVVLRYVEDKFNDKHLSTLQVYLRRVDVKLLYYLHCKIVENKNIKSSIYNNNFYMSEDGVLNVETFNVSRKNWSYRQASFLNKKLNISGKRVNLAIWDTAGQERFHALGPIYYRMSNGAILVYDITEEDSFQKVKSWVKELKKMLGSEICLVIAGNKIDLEKQRNVPMEEAENYAKTVGATHFSTSAKLNKGIEEMFLELTRQMIEKSQLNDMQNAGNMARSNNTRQNVVVVDDEIPPQPQPRSCCAAT